MPSPFPGMDPWLEHPALWPDVHRNLISVFQELLTPQVAPDFYVRGEERVYITGLSTPIEPDVFVVVQQRRTALAEAGGLPGRPAQPSAPVEFPLTSLEGEVHERYLEIREQRTHRVVTVIELLSPANKVRGAPRFEQFARKRAEVLNSDAHWIEIDLLRSGTRWDLAPGPSDYCVILSRVERRREEPPTGEAWLINMRDRLPTIAVPLRPPYPDVVLDLQQALDLVYDRAGYRYSVDYTQLTEPHLSASDEAWTRSVLRQARRPS